MVPRRAVTDETKEVHLQILSTFGHEKTRPLRLPLSTAENRQYCSKCSLTRFQKMLLYLLLISLAMLVLERCLDRWCN